ncbi:hypothetical protein PACTADRAFT_48148 [Pachysolen tannophilus NRRL Y-2460]|uniref:AB hydrolase-1 domain-containing protein n=1 Tax=Pachysolen tannophilus NRRL Y-2460 TaxID=669874 RepID=A0A1E4U2Z0_PACTA|nr:hypothetical protein PACTADRAFT_48148 [Pachysolen tannophilus NRRL Y-2460]
MAADNISYPFYNSQSSSASSSKSSSSSSINLMEKEEKEEKLKNQFEIRDFESKIINAIDIVDIVHAHGYKIHEHIVQTKDGYLLAIHRIIPKHIIRSSVKSRSYTAQLRDLNQPVVYFHHGLLTNSELFVLGDKTTKCLPFVLADSGYDVWLGNNRGNKYSRKHLELSSSSAAFWNYSLDEFALYDIPDTIEYILEATRQESLNYIGFSQGSAQCLAALSLSPKLNEKIKLFIGLSPAMVPRGLNHPVASFFVDSAPSFLYNLFGCRALIPSVVFWQQLLGPKYYRTVVDNSLILLFGWQTKNISSKQKQLGYQHMFSPSSVKSVVHWFQIIRSKRFQMYDEGGNAGSKLNTFSKNHKVYRVASFPTQTISTPMLLVYGKADCLIDIETTLENSSCHVETIGIENYEHMDTLWADEVETTVFQPVIKKLEEVNKKGNTNLKKTGVLVNGGLKFDKIRQPPVSDINNETIRASSFSSSSSPINNRTMSAGESISNHA